MPEFIKRVASRVRQEIHDRDENGRFYIAVVARHVAREFKTENPDFNIQGFYAECDLDEYGYTIPTPVTDRDLR